MTTEQMQYLQAVFHEGSLSAAARSLGLSQSTMSKSLQSLEKELGVSLFIRIRGKMIPTRQGYAVLDMARKVCSLQEQTAKRIHSLRSGAGRTLSVAFPYHWNYRSFSSVLAEFHRLCPDCAIRPVEYSDSGFYPMLRNKIVSLAVTVGETSASAGFRCLPMGKQEIFLAAPPGFLPASPGSSDAPPKKGQKKTADSCSAVKLHRLPQLPFALPDKGSVFASYLISYFQQLCFLPEVLFESLSPDCRLSAVRAGLGYTLIPEMFKNLAEELSVVPLSPPCFLPLTLIFADQPPVPEELKLMIRLLTRHAAAQTDSCPELSAYLEDEVLP